MLEEGKLWVASNEAGEHICLPAKLANRHGLIAGATGTGKTVTLKVLAESFSELGVPVFIADVKGDVTGLSQPGADSPDMQARIERFGLAGSFSYKGYPVQLWDIFGEKGIRLRTTISEMGPMLLSRIMELNDLQSDILSVVFRIADENNLLLIDTKDLKAILNYVSEHNKEFEADYGKMSPTSISAIVRAVVALESAGGDRFFGEPALNLSDWLSLDGGRGVINILESASLINNPKLYSTFLLWLLSELFEMLPEVGDMEKPKLVFFFDEAHLLFKDSPKALVDKVEQVVKLIRSKVVGVYFCTQSPKDIPDGVLAQLGNKVQHALRAYTPADQKAVKAAADSYRANPAFNTYDTILSLGTGEAVVSFLEEGGAPGVCEKAKILPPQSLMAAATDAQVDSLIKGSLLYSKYYEDVDPDSAYEFLLRRGVEEQKAAELAEQEALAEKEREKAEREAQKEYEKELARQEKEREKAEREYQKAVEREQQERRRAFNSMGNSISGAVGREVGRQTLGKFGKTLGGNVGANLGRGLFATFFRQ